MNLPAVNPANPCEDESESPGIFPSDEFQQLLTTLHVINLQQVSMAFAARR
jgi:hypothetical protein